MMKITVGGVRSLFVLALAAVVGSALAAGAFAGGSGPAKPIPKWPISAFSHTLHRAHSASEPASIPLTGATGMSLAAVKGGTEVYIGHRNNSAAMYCIWEQIASQGAGGGCGRMSDVESKGSVSLYEATEGAPAEIRALVPDGVSNMVVADSDGSSHVVAVTNNLAMYEDPKSPSVVSYSLPDGVTQTTNVATWRLAAHGPGAPGSGQ